MNPILREARSSPYIGSSDSEHACCPAERRPDCSSQSTAKLTNAASDEHFEGIKELVQFNAGSSSSSTSLIAGLQFCNEAADDETVLRQWAHIYAEQRAVHGRTEAPGRTKAESVDNLAQQQQQDEESSDEMATPTRQNSIADSVQSAALAETTNLRGGNGKQHHHNSETNLLHNPQSTHAHSTGFRLLEKCCSVELSPATAMFPSTLARSKEMPNIADIDVDDFSD